MFDEQVDVYRYCRGVASGSLRVSVSQRAVSGLTEASLFSRLSMDPVLIDSKTSNVVPLSFGLVRESLRTMARFSRLMPPVLSLLHS